MNSMGVVMDVLSENFYEAMAIFEDVVKNTSFPEEEIDKQKEIALAMIKEQKKSIFDNGLFELKKLIYRNHPYAMRVLGTPDTVMSFTRDDIKTFYDRYFSPSGAVLTIVGDVDPDEVIEDLESRFKYWEGSNPRIRNREVPDIERFSRRDLYMDKEQSLVLIGYKGVSLKDHQKYPLEVLTSLLSGSDGILFRRLREREGLVYASGVISVPEVNRGYIVFYAATAEENIPKTKNLILEIIQSLDEKEFLYEDINASKNMLISEQAFSLETNHSLSMICALDQLYGLGYDNYKNFSGSINSVTREDIQKTVKDIFGNENWAEVIIRSD
jgi:zinc protease